VVNERRVNITLLPFVRMFVCLAVCLSVHLCLSTFVVNKLTINL